MNAISINKMQYALSLSIIICNIPSIHLLQCSHCDLYRIAAMPKEKATKQKKCWINSDSSAQSIKASAFCKVIYISPPTLILSDRTQAFSLTALRV